MVIDWVIDLVMEDVPVSSCFDLEFLEFLEFLRPPEGLVLLMKPDKGAPRISAVRWGWPLSSHPEAHTADPRIAGAKLAVP